MKIRWCQNPPYIVNGLAVGGDWLEPNQASQLMTVPLHWVTTECH